MLLFCIFSDRGADNKFDIFLSFYHCNQCLIFIYLLFCFVLKNHRHVWSFSVAIGVNGNAKITFVVVSIHHDRRLPNYSNFYFWEPCKCKKGSNSAANLCGRCVGNEAWFHSTRQKQDQTRRPVNNHLFVHSSEHSYQHLLSPIMPKHRHIVLLIL